MGKALENVLSATIALAALAVGAATIHREFAPRPALGAGRPSRYVDDWRSMLADARLVGNPRAPVTMIEFVDFQCPSCRRFNSTVTQLRATFGDSLAIAYVHLPLGIHAQAVGAASAVECSHNAGRLTAAIDYIFERQDSLGKKPWTWFAVGAGVKDTVRFAACMADSSATPVVQAGIRRSVSAGVGATPTILLNGWRYGGIPSDSELVRAIGDLIVRKRPYRDFPRSGIAAP